MLKAKFEDLLTFLKDKTILVTTHDRVDIDGLVSCFVLKYLLEYTLKGTKVFLYFSEISKSSKKYIEKFQSRFDYKFQAKEALDMKDIEVILILDTNNINLVQFPEDMIIYQKKIPYIFIDHHLNLNKENNGNYSSLNIISDEYSSTAEIIYKLSKAYNIQLSSLYRALLISGILTDSGFFTHGNNKTIRNVAGLLNKDFDINELISLLDRDEDISEKIAKIKAMQRVNLIREGDFLIGVTHIGSFEANVATSLIKNGFDIAVVISNKESKFRISTRARKSLCLKKNLHLGKILEEISILYEGSGGGHDGAAAYTGKENIEQIINVIIEKIKEILTL